MSDTATTKSDDPPTSFLRGVTLTLVHEIPLENDVARINCQWCPFTDNVTILPNTSEDEEKFKRSLIDSYWPEVIHFRICLSLL